ncbi:MAG: molybdopterin molybdotransferase MoeA [Flavobacteriales bacterium]|nr:MAG: molybdopterin molybdotransferase MoeA [Flavobacteriales bacterium]
MISVETAKELIVKNIQPNPTSIKSLNFSLNHYLANDVISDVDIPLFNQSAMDGYAFKFSDKQLTLKVIDEIAAGDTKWVDVKNGEAIRIFTGSKLPESCDTVVMQELTERNGNELIVKDEGLKFQGNVRLKGNQLKKGAVALKKGTKLTPAAIGFLATLGIEKVSVYEKPSVAILATGSELMPLGSSLKEGQIFESNTHMLNAAINPFDVKLEINVIKDDLTTTKIAIKSALDKFDVVILSGGISVGDYDFVKECLLENEVKEVFHKIKQKPGKPLFFGKKGKKLVFALPGNPAAALSCFYMYVFPALQLTLGNLNPFLPSLQLPLAEKFIKKEGRAVFLKSVIQNNKVELLKGQDSDALQSFAIAHGLTYIPSEKDAVEQNELVEFYLLPQYVV